MKGFKNSTRTQSGHGYDEVPTRPATSKDVAAAKAVRIITPGKSTPRVTDSMILGKGEDKAPGERGARRFANGGPVYHSSVEYVGKDTNKLDRSAPRINTAQIKNDFNSWGKLKELANHAQGSEAAARLVDAVRADIKEKGWDSHYSWISNSEGKRPTLPSRKTLYGLADKANAAAKKANTPEFAARDVRKRDDIPFDGALLTSRGMKRIPSDSDKPKRFAVGGMVPPRSGGMPAQGKPLTAQNMNDGRLAPPRPAPRPKAMPVASRAPLIKSVGKPVERMTPPRATSNYEPGGNPNTPYAGPKMSMPDMAAAIKSSSKMSSPIDALRALASDDEMSAARSTGALARLSADRGYKKGGKVVEKGSKEVYASKAAMKKHEASESKSKERSEHAGYAKGGKSKWC